MRLRSHSSDQQTGRTEVHSRLPGKMDSCVGCPNKNSLKQEMALFQAHIGSLTGPAASGWWAEV